MNDERRKPGNSGGGQGDGGRPKSSPWLALGIAILVVILIGTIYNAVSNSQYTETSFNEFEEARLNGNLSEVQIHYYRIIYMTK